MSVLTTKQIMEIIPHRQPFLLIDTVEELESGVRAVAKKCVSYNEPFFGGHFPNEPVMPGVLILRHWHRPERLQFFRWKKTVEKRHILRESIQQSLNGK